MKKFTKTILQRSFPNNQESFSNIPFPTGVFPDETPKLEPLPPSPTQVKEKSAQEMSPKEREVVTQEYQTGSAGLAWDAPKEFDNLQNTTNPTPTTYKLDGKEIEKHLTPQPEQKWWEEAVEMVKKHEGLRLEPYEDTLGYLTIGYGHNLEAGISKEQAEALLRLDMQRALEDAKIIFGKEWEKFPDKIKAVLVDMLFNLGRTKFLKFRRMLDALRRHDYEKVAQEMKNSLWCKQVKTRCTDLVKIVEEVAKEEKKTANPTFAQNQTPSTPGDTTTSS
ncbi:MAG: hypothetical protein C6I01_02145 [Epsilonproteobacteria bacterium]|nr:hypothetical protein [Campylobacterota bacterium]NPA89386.1 glycoside hydrolase family protein [Campylobacterota bacterium]